MIFACVALRKESVDRNSTSFQQISAYLRSLSARRAWIEIPVPVSISNTVKSLSARRAWIEILFALSAPLFSSSLSARRAWIEIKIVIFQCEKYLVALRKESVDRNDCFQFLVIATYPSLSARRAWIEMSEQYSKMFDMAGRSPQGERG